MKVVRPLLMQGNQKLGESIFHFDLPAVESCPGSTGICRDVCYATRGRYVFPQVQERLAWNHEQSLREDFSKRMTGEITSRGISTVRLHCSGDFYSEEYCQKWDEVMQQCHSTTFFFYTRSWRDVGMYAMIELMAALNNVFVWFSIDDDCYPDDVPKRVRLAYLMTHLDSVPDCDLVFADRAVRPYVQELTLLCPNETKQATNCSLCRKCFS